MKVQTYRSDEERAILMGMIVHDRVLGRIASHLSAERRPFRSKWCNIIGRWCLDYYAKYEKAPRQAVESLFNEFARKSNDEDSVEVVEKFLMGLSDDYKVMARELNTEYLVDTAARYFNEVKLEKLSKEIESSLANGELEEAQKLVSGFTPVAFASDDMVDALTDEDVWLDAIASKNTETLIQFPGELGTFFGDEFCRDSFVAFLAPEKRGKSFVLMDLAFRGAEEKRNTVLYSAGDMSQHQMMRRLIARVCRRPLGRGEVRKPTDLRMSSDGRPLVRYKYTDFAQAITRAEMAKVRADLKMKSASSYSRLKMRCVPNSTLTIGQLEADLDHLIRDNFVPDILVIDYADIMAPEPGSGDDPRNQINTTWKKLRGLSQKYHLCVVTATQANADSYTRKTMTRSNFSEDKRKIAHVTAMFGLNQDEEEKKQGIMRINAIARREEEYFESRCVTVAGCLKIAAPMMLSHF